MPALWSDKKRILGMPISFTRYRVDDGRLYLSEGFFHTVENETLLYRVLDITMGRSLADKLFGVGTITLRCADQSHPMLQIKNVKNPAEVRKMLSELVEAERRRMRVAGREMYGAGQSELSVEVEGGEYDGE